MFLNEARAILGTNRRSTEKCACARRAPAHRVACRLLFVCDRSALSSHPEDVSGGDAERTGEAARSQSRGERGCSARRQTPSRLYLPRAKARRASWSSFSPIEPRAPSPRRLAEAPTRWTARCLRSTRRRANRFIVLVPEEFPDYHYFLDAVFASTKTKPQIVEERDSVEAYLPRSKLASGVALAADRYAHVFGRRIKTFTAYARAEDDRHRSRGAERPDQFHRGEVLGMREAGAFCLADC